MNVSNLVAATRASPPCDAKRRRRRRSYRGVLAILFFVNLATAAPTTAPATAPTPQPRGGSVIAPDRRDVPGVKFAITQGEVYVPSFFKPSDHLDVVVWFLGQPWVVEQEFYERRTKTPSCSSPPRPRCKTISPAHSHSRTCSALCKSA